MRVDVNIILAGPKPYATSLRPSESNHVTGNVVVMHLKGPLVQGPAVTFFLDQVRLLVCRGIINFVVDLAAAADIDSRGAGGLAAAYNSIRDARGKIKYVLVSEELPSAILQNHLDRVFEIYSNESLALASFKRVGAKT